MYIVAHRGFWKKASEKNTEASFRRAFELGFGVETDIRDHQGVLVISHDIPSKGCMTFEYFLNIYIEYKNNSVLALNIKSDGLHEKIEFSLKKFDVHNYFVFDMSVPDMLGYHSRQINVFSRVSELEYSKKLNLASRGIWLDQFYGNWYTEEYLIDLIKEHNAACVVSPELHSRDYLSCWNMLSKIDKDISGKILLCTDFPDKAKEFFHE